jgi:ketosteroid isomerase-like protein
MERGEITTGTMIEVEAEDIRMTEEEVVVEEDKEVDIVVALAADETCKPLGSVVN